LKKILKLNRQTRSCAFRIAKFSLPERLTLIALLCLLSSLLHAQIPRLIPYQGVITDTKGNPKPDGSYELTLALYQQESGGDKIWQESKMVDLKNGMFSTYVGDGAPLTVAFDKPYWLGIRIGSGVELGKRVRLSSVAYALGSTAADSAKRAIVADSAGKAGVADRVTNSGNGVRSDTVTTRMVMAKDTHGVALLSSSGVGIRVNGSGNVGIGTTDPQQILHLKTTTPIIRLDGVGGAGYESGGIEFWNDNGKYIGASIKALVTGPDYGYQSSLIFSTTHREVGGVVAAEERVRITENGNVGIGTPTPGDRLHVYSSATTGEIRIGGGNGVGNHRLFLQASATNAYIDSYGNDSYNALSIEASPLRLNASSHGNVGIGTNDPTSKLQVVGLLEYADNAAARSAGLTEGAFYRTGDLLKVVH
jgi:hypothetical protein